MTNTSIYEHMIGGPVLVRAHRAGVYLGTLTAAYEDGSIRLTARRLWRWSGALDSTVLADIGPAGGRIGPMSYVVLPPGAEIIEIVKATDAALSALAKVSPWVR